VIVLLEAQDGLFSEDALTVAANRVDASVWLATMDGNMLFVNDCAAQSLRIDRGAMLNRRWVDLLHPDDREFTLGTADYMTRARKVVSVVCRIAHGHGGFRWTQHVAWPVLGRRRGYYVGVSYGLQPGAAARHEPPDAVLTALLREASLPIELPNRELPNSGPRPIDPSSGGEPRRGFVVHSGGRRSVEDVLDRERLERVATSELVLNAPTPIIAVDLDLRIRVWNRAIESLIGLTAAQVLGRTAMDAFPFLQENGVLDCVRQALDGHENESTIHYPFPTPFVATVRRRPMYRLGGIIEGAVIIFRSYLRVVPTKPAIRAPALIAALVGLVLLALVNVPGSSADDVDDLVNPYQSGLDVVAL
jgi:PAS domain S-box-containing protein